jgi:16S rRNA (cytidine1402-2'-O)-methyltransferase
LYIVGTPIGNAGDLSSRAAATLASVDFVICEEWKPARDLMRRLGLEKELVQMNEHNERDVVPEIATRLKKGEQAALISDCGMPVFADPGTALVPALRGTGVRVTAVPGPTSLTTALALCPFPADRFFYYGFLSQKSDRRKQELRSLSCMNTAIVFLDAPYRLLSVLPDLAAAFGPDRQVCIACDLTTDDEVVFTGSLRAANEYFAANKKKREYVIVTAGPDTAQRRHKRRD